MRCFGMGDAADGVALDGGAIRHVAARAGQAGLVELWPPVRRRSPRSRPIPLALPVDAPARRRAAHPARPRDRRDDRGLARDAASGWSRAAAPIRPGDIMVLVRRRNEFVGDLLRALKQRGVPVAGADRLVLTEQLAVQDLVALGQFLLLPEDDLTLATVLKGPLFGISEEQLFALAYDRGDEHAVAPAAPPRAGRSARCARRPSGCAALLARADFAPPYELYAEILGAERRAAGAARTARTRGRRPDRGVPRAGARL